MQLFTLRPFNKMTVHPFTRTPTGEETNSCCGNMNWHFALLWWTLCTKITSGWKTGLPGARRGRAHTHTHTVSPERLIVQGKQSECTINKLTAVYWLEFLKESQHRDQHIKHKFSS